VIHSKVLIPLINTFPQGPEVLKRKDCYVVFTFEKRRAVSTTKVSSGMVMVVVVAVVVVIVILVVKS